MPGEPVGRRSRYAAAISTSLDDDDSLQKSNSRSLATSTSNPQPVLRRHTLCAASSPTHANQPMTPHPPFGPPTGTRVADSDGVVFDFGFNSLGIPAGAARQRYNSMPSAGMAGPMNDVPSATPERQTYSSAPPMRMQPQPYSMAAPMVTQDGTLPALPSNLRRGSLANNPDGVPGSFTGSGSFYASAPPVTQQSHSSLYNIQRQPANLASMNLNMLGSTQNPSFTSAGVNEYGSFMAPAGAGPLSACGFSTSSATSSTGSSTLERDLSFLGLGSIATESFRSDGSLSHYAPASSAYGAPHGSFMQPGGYGVTGSVEGAGGSMMRPAGSGGFGAGHGASMMSGYGGSMYGASQCTFHHGMPSRYGSVARSFAAPSSSMHGHSMLDQFQSSMSLMGTSAFGLELASSQTSQRTTHMTITPATKAGTVGTSQRRAAESPSASSTSVTRWVKPLKETSTTRRGRRTSAPWKSEASQNVMELSIGAAAKFLGLDYVGTAVSGAGVSILTIIEHKSAVASDRGYVYSEDGYEIHVQKGGQECVCTTDECVWRPCGGSGLSSVLLTDTAQQFAESGENGFVWLVDRSANAKGKIMKSSKATPSPSGSNTLELVASLCRAAVKAATSKSNARDSGTTELVMSVIAYHPPSSGPTQNKSDTDAAQFTDLLSSSSGTERRGVEVATSPITGSCVNGCVLFSVASVPEFDSTAQSVSESINRLGAVALEESILLWQLNLLKQDGASSTSGASSSDVVLSSFTVACTSSPSLMEAVLDQSCDSQWALFKYGLGLGPCTILAVACVEESDSSAADAFAALERLRYHGHLGPRKGSVQGWIDEAVGRIAELATLDDMLLMDTVSGTAAGVGVSADASITTVHVREKMHNQRMDFQSFLRHPSLAKAPLYVVNAVVPRPARSLCLDEGDTSSKLSATPPFFSAYIRRPDDPLGQRLGVTTLIEALCSNVVVVRQRHCPGMPFGGFEESVVVPEAKRSEEYNAALAESKAVANLESLFISGFNTSVIGISPIPVSSEQGTTTRLDGSSAGEETAMSGVKACVGLAVRSVFEKIEAEQMGTVLRCCVSMYHVCDTKVVDLLDGEDSPAFFPLTLVLSPLLGTAPNLITQRPLRRLRDYESVVHQGLRQLRVVNRCAKDSDKKYLSYTVIAVELKQLRKNYPGDVYVSVMTGVSLGENYNVLGDPSLFYDKAPVAAPCVALLKSFLTQCARAHCVAFLDEASTMEVVTLLGRVRDLKRMETRPVTVGSAKKLVQRLTKVRARLTADQRVTSRGKDNVVRIEGMLNDAAQLLDNPRTTDVVYYLRWADDDETLDPRTANTGTGTDRDKQRRGSQVKISTPSTINGRPHHRGSITQGDTSGAMSACPSSAPSVASSTGTSSQVRSGRAGRHGSQSGDVDYVSAAGHITPALYDEALAVCGTLSTTPSTYYGTQYKRDPVMTSPSSPSTGLPVPSVVLLRPSSALNEAGIAPRTSTDLELRDVCTATTTYYAADEVVVVPGAVSDARRAATSAALSHDTSSSSAFLFRSVTCVSSGHTAAVLFADTATLTTTDSLSWLTARQIASAFLAELKRAASSVPYLVGGRAILLSEADPNTMTDLLGEDGVPMDALKYSPLCGPTSKDATTVPIKSAGDVDEMVRRIQAALARPQPSSSSPRDPPEVRGAVAIQLVVHRFVSGARGDADVELSCLWLVCGDTHGDWLSAAVAMPKSCTAKLLDFWLGGPCYTTAVLAITPPSSMDDLGLRRRFTRLSKVQDSFHAVTLGTPRNGSVAQFEAYLRNYEGCGRDDVSSPRLKAMLSEAAQLRQKQYDKCVSSGKLPGLLAHESKMFTMMDGAS